MKISASIFILSLLAIQVASAQESLTIDDGIKLTTDPQTAITVTGDWTDNGEFNGNAVLNGTGRQKISSPGGEKFQKLRINNRSEEGVVLNTNVSIKDSLQLWRGLIDNDTHDIEIEDQATINRLNGRVRKPPIFRGFCNIHYDGDDSVTTGDEIPTNPLLVRNVIINNPNGVTLDRNLFFNGTLAFLRGKLRTTGAYSVILGPEATVVGERPGNYLVGNLLVARTVGRLANTFGGIGLELQSGLDDLGRVDALRQTGQAAVTNIFGRNSIKRKWTINAEHQPTRARTMTMAWLADDDNDIRLSSLQAWLSENQGQTWFAVGGLQDASQRRSVTVSTTAFSQWTVNDYNGCRVTGDINADCSVTQADVTLVVKYVLYGTGLSAYQISLADLTGDRAVDVRDVVTLVSLAR